ncbi:MAG: hypothetical protein V4498_09940 [candidate division FCPU426 bacterium]
MKRLILGALLLAPAWLEAKVHFINRGVKYHIGDNRYDRSEDREFVDAYPVVGQEWIQAFRVSEADVVKVRIAHIWGVDDCPYCKVMVAIDDHDMGRLTRDNNHTPFDTLDPLAWPVQPGKTYLLKVVSYGDEKVDDFVIEGVSVETARAEVIFLKPGPVLKMPDQPMPMFSVPPMQAPPQVDQTQSDPCGSLSPLKDWALGQGKARDQMELESAGDFASSGRLGLLKAGESVDFYFRTQAAGDADKVGRAFELLCGDPGGDDSGWVLTLDAAGNVAHSNLRRKGSYRAATFAPRAYVAGQWNRARLSYCPDHMLRLSLNGQQVSTPLKLDGTPQGFFVRALGVKASLAGAQKF